MGCFDLEEEAMDEEMETFRVEINKEWGKREQSELEDSFKGMSFFVQTNKNQEEIIEDMEEIFPGCDVRCGAYDFEINEFDERVYAVPLLGNSYIIAFFNDNIDDAIKYGKCLRKWALQEYIKIYKVTSEYELWG